MTPDFAPRIWSDGRDIYLEFPAKEGAPPYVGRFAFTDAGLSKALKMIPNVALVPGYQAGSHNSAEKILNAPIRIARKTLAKRQSAKFSEGVKSRAKLIARGVKY